MTNSMSWLIIDIFKFHIFWFNLSRLYLCTNLSVSSSIFNCFRYNCSEYSFTIFFYFCMVKTHVPSFGLNFMMCLLFHLVSLAKFSNFCDLYKALTLSSLLFFCPWFHLILSFSSFLPINLTVHLHQSSSDQVHC